MLALITATHNSISTIGDCLASAKSLDDRVKHFFVDGESTDGTKEYLTHYAQDKCNVNIQAQIGTGLYQAINQGVEAAIHDRNVRYIGLLHSDDRLITDNYQEYLFEIDRSRTDVYYSDIQFHDSDDRTIRVWKSGRYSRVKFHTGWMPPHTSMIVSKSVYQEVGLYNPAFGTAADYEWIVRILATKHDTIQYFPKRTVSMLVGGASNASLKARLRANAMDGKVWASHSRLQSALIRVCKPMRKIGQFVTLAGSE